MLVLLRMRSLPIWQYPLVPWCRSASVNKAAAAAAAIYPVQTGVVSYVAHDVSCVRLQITERELVKPQMLVLICKGRALLRRSSSFAAGCFVLNLSASLHSII